MNMARVKANGRAGQPREIQREVCEGTYHGARLTPTTGGGPLEWNAVPDSCDLISSAADGTQDAVRDCRPRFETQSGPGLYAR